MPFHFCADELFFIMSSLPFLGAAFAWLRARWHGQHRKTECAHDDQH